MLEAMRVYYQRKGEGEVAPWLIPSFVIGKCVQDKLVKEVHYENNSLTLNYNDITAYLVTS